MTTHKKIRVLEGNNGLIYIQDLKFGLVWWTVFKTYYPAGARAFLDFTNLEYNEKTGYYE